MPLTRERQIWACASMLIEKYGETAWFQASVRADELMAANDFNGHKMFMAILARIEELQRMEPTGTMQ